jgi:hypothetical protein
VRLLLVDKTNHRFMDANTRMKRVEAMEAIKDKALEMSVGGEDDLSVKDFINSAKRELAFEVPDEESFRKAVKAAGKYKNVLV